MYFQIPTYRFKSGLVQDFFISPADKNYTYARFFRGMGDNSESYWQALQALEKYMKAGLVLNGVSLLPRRFGHNLLILKEEHDKVFGDFSIKELEKPANMNDDLWRQDALPYILKKINDMGSPDGRYGLNSTENHRYDVFILDELVRELRRRTVCLDWVVGESYPLDNEISELVGESYATVLATRPRYQHRKLPEFDVHFSDIGNTFSDALHHWNMAFPRSDDDILKKVPRRIAAQFGGFSNSSLFMVYRHTNEVTLETIPSAVDCLRWVVDNIKIPSDARKAYVERIEEMEGIGASGNLVSLRLI